jgi:hypothetical protein
LMLWACTSRARVTAGSAMRNNTSSPWGAIRW